jgi:large subunit ribosomal protein L28
MKFKQLEVEEIIMARRCDLTGKRRQIGHKVSHSNIKTKVQKKPNLHTKRVFDPETGQTIKLKLSAHAIRTLDKVGSLSKYIRKYAKK